MSFVRARLGVIAACVIGLAGCQTVGETYDRWFGSRPTKKPAELVPIRPVATAKILWQGNVGEAGKNVFFPTVSGNVVYAASARGNVAGFDSASGSQVTQIDAGQQLSAGAGGDPALVLVGTSGGQILAFSRNGRPLWKTQLSGEVLAPPVTQGGIVVARTSDGSLFGLNAADGRRNWVYRRTTPALSVRGHSGVVIDRGAVFAGLAGGRLVALALKNGTVGWEGIVALPRGTTELERVADVTSLPVVDGRQVCAVAFQGRVACFDEARGTTIWARDISSYAGMNADSRYLYITDDRNAIIALDKTSGASVWKQDKLSGRGVSGPLALGRYVVVGDFEGYLHVLSADDGSFAARIATDGSAIGAPPVALASGSFVVQTRNGGVFAISVQ